MLEFGLYLTAVGMGGVFVILSILAFFMWLIGRIFGKEVKIKDEETFSRDEIAAIVAAITQYEAVKVPYIESPLAWKRYGRIESMR